MTLRIAIAGTGLITRVHARAAHKLPDVVLEAVVNHRPESMAAFAAEFQIPRQYDNVADLLKDGDVDALVVCTPNYLHAPQSIAALEAGVHVMVEKPLAMNTPEAEAMLSASQESGALLMVAHCWRFSPEVRWLREQMAAGSLGRIIRTKGYCSHVNRGPERLVHPEGTGRRRRDRRHGHPRPGYGAFFARRPPAGERICSSWHFLHRF